MPRLPGQDLETIMEEEHPRYGLIGQRIAQPGQRAALAALLTEGTGTMPGNVAYLIGEDSENPDALWIVELWADKGAHAASDRKSTRLNTSHYCAYRMPSSA